MKNAGYREFVPISTLGSKLTYDCLSTPVFYGLNRKYTVPQSTHSTSLNEMPHKNVDVQTIRVIEYPCSPVILVDKIKKYFFLAS